MSYRPDVAIILSPLDGGVDAVFVPIYRKWWQVWRPFLLGFREAKVHVEVSPMGRTGAETLQ